MSRLRENAQEILSLYNFFNGAIIFDTNAVAVYYYNNRPDLNPLGEKDVVGKSLFELYPGLSPSESTVIKALQEGIPTANMAQRIKNYKGTEIFERNTTLPIFEENKIVGAVEVSTYITDKTNRNLYITPIDSGRKRSLYTIDSIISNNSIMNEIKRKIAQISKTDSSVLIYGKTGTGKELVAEAIHTGGARRSHRFLHQNCAAIPTDLLESILFGSVKGSFTGAEDRIGLLESAEGGTLFLDEINSMDLNLQAKILRAIEEKKIMRVGGYEARPVDVRIIAATNEDPIELLKNGRLRSDLYFRLRVVQINLPTLKERKEDILLLADYFIKKCNKRMKKNVVGMEEKLEEIFLTYEWPGNVRELENIIEGGFNFCEDHLLRLSDIPWWQNKSELFFPDWNLEAGITLKEALWNYERLLIVEEMNKCETIKEVEANLGLSRQNLAHKMKQYKIENKFDINEKIDKVL